MSVNRKIIIAGNWKMNTNLNSATQLARAVAEQSIPDGREIVLACPYPLLHGVYLTLRDCFKDDKIAIRLASQDVSEFSDGAYTGDVSAAMLNSLYGVSDVIIGHSERRVHHGETNEIVGTKIMNVLQSSVLRVLFCLGENLQERDSGKANEVVEEQLLTSLQQVDATTLTSKEANTLRVVICYEPIWAIGTGKVASTEEAEAMHAHIRNVLSKKYDSQLAERFNILYGGSVKATNAEQLLSQQNIDGVLVGGASLDADGFKQIIISGIKN